MAFLPPAPRTHRASIPPSSAPSTSQPRPPSSWKWRCYRCLIEYNIACTQRCLQCSHRCCFTTKTRTTTTKTTTTTTTTTTASRPSAAASSSSSSSHRLRRPRPAPKRSARRRRCRSSFDFGGWRAMGEWRRGAQAHTGRDARRMARARLRRFVARTHDCSADCDYPTECQQERARAPPATAVEEVEEEDSEEEEEEEEDSSEEEEEEDSSEEEDSPEEEEESPSPPSTIGGDWDDREDVQAQSPKSPPREDEEEEEGGEDEGLSEGEGRNAADSSDGIEKTTTVTVEWE